MVALTSADRVEYEDSSRAKKSGLHQALQMKSGRARISHIEAKQVKP
jgi:hypothetical protein